MKGILRDEELNQLPPGCVDKVVALSVPTLDAQRHAVFINPAVSMVDR